MDIEQQTYSSQIRKSSCSIIDSNSTDQSRSASKRQLPAKHKRLKKLSKVGIKPKQQTKPEPPQPQSLHQQNRRVICEYLRQLRECFGLHADTYLVCLKVIKILRFDGDPALCYQVAAVVCYLVQKMHESSKINFQDLVAWTKGGLSSEIYVDSEAVILMGLGFQLPTINWTWELSQIEDQVAMMENAFSI